MISTLLFGGKCFGGGKWLVVLACFALINNNSPFAQTTVVTDSPFVSGTTVVIPGKHYKRSGYHNIFWGQHYRREWSTPVRVRNFFLDTAKGGLTPIKEGGSRQTKNLRLKDKTGKEYVLRSVDKDFGQGLPDEFHGTFASRIAKDQASIGYPFAAITVLPMIRATGIYHTNPVIVFVPSQPALGEFDKEYGNQLYLFEERPDENQEDAPHFGNAKNVIGSEKLYEHLNEDFDHRVDQHAFAKARLFDMLIGDWGRHADQWRWAQFETGDEKIYRAIPRDRDQVYTTFDGLWPWFATNIAGAIHLESFKPHLSNVKKFNLPGRPLDRRFTNELTRADWLAAAVALQESLTDSVIEYSVRQLPPEHFAISGTAIIDKLKSRRDQLDKYAVDYYAYLATQPELLGSDDDEFFEIDRPSRDELIISIFKIKKDKERKAEPYYSRTFTGSETKEIRIYSLGGNDVFSFNGEKQGKIELKIIDPEGTDSFTTDPGGRARVWRGRQFQVDSAHREEFDFKFLPLLSPSQYGIFENDPLPLFTNSGMKVSFNLFYHPHSWRKPEYDQVHMFTGVYGFLREVFNIGYVGRFGRAVGNWDLVAKARADLPSVQNYFGTGNETENHSDQANYHRIESTRLYGGLSLERRIRQWHFLSSTLFYQYVNPDEREIHFLDDPVMPDSQSDFGPRHFGGAEAWYRLRKTDNDLCPSNGIDFSIAAGYIQNLQDRNRSFTNLLTSLAGYVPLGKSLTLASRVGFATLAGQADFYHLNRLSGNENLRGYARERFTGKTVLFNNNEIRWTTATRNYFFSGRIGLLAFYDQGRVWQPLEVSEKWHRGYGGGVILIPFNRVALTGTYCISDEGKRLLLQAGLFF